MYDIPVFFWGDWEETDDFECDELSDLLGAMDMVGERMLFSLTLQYLFFPWYVWQTATALKLDAESEKLLDSEY
jgi:hypothetical protein